MTMGLKFCFDKGNRKISYRHFARFSDFFCGKTCEMTMGLKCEVRIELRIARCQ